MSHDLMVNYQQNIQKAVQLLKAEGCEQVFLFGSLTHGEVRHGSDIDIAIRGYPSEYFFQLTGKLLLALDYSFDLIDLDSQDGFGQYLQQHGELVRIDF
ncbi:nucleotidyltransferase domain-containing protein [Candidatus Albibeggiatoa sp. nov. BB20]|uniref:nucleotidyltransferase family protein n=1 Tax=Candidatus Albibeggiatoa sp. nov. BB20 TaxID=3162723 RepID=UPI0033657723